MYPSVEMGGSPIVTMLRPDRPNRSEDGIDMMPENVDASLIVTVTEQTTVPFAVLEPTWGLDGENEISTGMGNAVGAVASLT